jgi:DNA-directed RNA polymerase specialized sigma24 family protein
MSRPFPEPGELQEPEASTQPDIADLVAARSEHDRSVDDLRQIKPNERLALHLQALGYRYSEIEQATGASYTAVNRRLTEGRARLRRLARDRGEDPRS